MRSNAPLECLSDGEVSKSLQRFGLAAKQHYGTRLTGLYLFGSRARHDHHPESDADIVVVLADPFFDRWQEFKILNNLSYDELVEQGIDIECHVVAENEWNNPELHNNPSLIRNMRRDSQPLLRE